MSINSLIKLINIDEYCYRLIFKYLKITEDMTFSKRYDSNNFQFVNK